MKLIIPSSIADKVEPQLREIRPGHWVRSAHPTSERSGERETVNA